MSVAVLCRGIAEHRGRPLHVRTFPKEAACLDICGTWIATSQADYIFVERCTSRIHRDHIVLHEIGHMICDHRLAVLGPDPSKLDSLFEDLDPETVQRVLGRTDYSVTQEREAEQVAGLFVEEMARIPGPRIATGQLARAEQALGIG
ncbi:hypothetical protein [Actinosynnema sp. ALI-1.44]|uniref:hypothetical protein n=1 Tax=Actinosynnema sp. ALI-1.44 TaxID=1933779 RepID=UPI001178427E|nr:hypothetical protein [Actinosynnema sp. ALI-1.44]